MHSSATQPNCKLFIMNPFKPEEDKNYTTVQQLNFWRPLPIHLHKNEKFHYSKVVKRKV